MPTSPTGHSPGCAGPRLLPEIFDKSPPFTLPHKHMNAVKGHRTTLAQMNYPPARVAIVLPTRNRSELAISTIRTLLGQLQEDCRLIVSDNSTSSEALDSLRSDCEAFDCPWLRYQVPPQPLPMAEHWEWAITQALGDSLFDPTHVMIATDRMLFYQRALSHFREALRQA